jgi:hypothetical protein
MSCPRSNKMYLQQTLLTDTCYNKSHQLNYIKNGWQSSFLSTNQTNIPSYFSYISQFFGFGKYMTTTSLILCNLKVYYHHQTIWHWILTLDSSIHFTPVGLCIALTAVIMNSSARFQDSAIVKWTHALWVSWTWWKECLDYSTWVCTWERKK